MLLEAGELHIVRYDILGRVLLWPAELGKLGPWRDTASANAATLVQSRHVRACRDGDVWGITGETSELLPRGSATRSRYEVLVEHFG